MLQQSFVYHKTIAITDSLVHAMLSHDWNKPQLQRLDDINFNKCQVIFYTEFSNSSLYRELYLKNYDSDDTALVDMTRSIIDEIRQLWPDYKLVKGEIAYCPPNVKQGAHIDPRVFHQLAYRVHIPIVTNTDSFLITGNDRQHMEQGEIWTFNNSIMHYGENLGSTPRVHLVFDLMKNETFSKFIEDNDEDSLYQKMPSFR